MGFASGLIDLCLLGIKAVPTPVKMDSRQKQLHTSEPFRENNFFAQDQSFSSKVAPFEAKC